MTRLVSSLLLLAVPLAATPIRTTSPGTIVFRGGAVVPRYFLIEETAGPYRITRHRLLFYGAYSPTPRTLLELEAPFDWVRGRGPGGAFHLAGPGNAMVWAKYRFHRRVGMWSDRHAAVRFGLALPTGVRRSLPADRVVSEQVQPGAGAWSPVIEVTYGGGVRRFVYHLDAQQTFAVERGGLRPGHTTRGNLDLEYVILPRDYRRPGRELFGLLEVSATHRTSAQSRARALPGTGGTQLLLAPGVQYVISRRLLVEASLQFPVLSHTGVFQLRAKSSLLLGFRWLF